MNKKIKEEVKEFIAYLIMGAIILLFFISAFI